MIVSGFCFFFFYNLQNKWLSDTPEHSPEKYNKYIIYNQVLAYRIMEAENSHDLLSAAGDSRKFVVV